MSHETCPVHEGEDATNGCARCDAETRLGLPWVIIRTIEASDPLSAHAALAMLDADTLERVWRVLLTVEPRRRLIPDVLAHAEDCPAGLCDCGATGPRDESR